MRIAPVGGGFGGKTEHTKFIVGPTAVAAHAVKRPVRLIVPREEDTALIGKRHAFYGQSQVAMDMHGILHGMQTEMWGDGGAFYESATVSGRRQFVIMGMGQRRLRVQEFAWHVHTATEHEWASRSQGGPPSTRRFVEGSLPDTRGVVVARGSMGAAFCARGSAPPLTEADHRRH